jgi:hypothetical protein
MKVSDAVKNLQKNNQALKIKELKLSRLLNMLESKFHNRVSESYQQIHHHSRSRYEKILLKLYMLDDRLF